MARDDDEEDLRSRSDARRRRKADEQRLADLAVSLLRLSPKRRASLQLPESLEDALEEAERMPNPRARARQLRVVRRELREGDHEAIGQRVHALLNPTGYPSADERAAAAWVEKMSADAGAVDGFVEKHPRADRQRLRTLARNLRKAEASRNEKARRALQAAITEELARARADEREGG